MKLNIIGIMEDIMEDKILEKVAVKISQRLIENQVAYMELEVKYEDALEELSNVKLQLDQARIQLDLQNMHPDASIEEVKPEDLNLPPLNK